MTNPNAGVEHLHAMATLWRKRAEYARDTGKEGMAVLYEGIAREVESNAAADAAILKGAVK